MPFDYGLLDDTALAHQLHNLAAQLAAAKAAKDVPQVQALLAEFERVAAEERRRGATPALLTLINQVHDGTVEFLEDLAGTTGKVGRELLAPLLWPLIALVVVGVLVLVFWRKVQHGDGG